MRHLVVGVILIALGVLGMVVWWEVFGLVMRGVVPFLLLVFGTLGILSSYSRLDFRSERDEDSGEVVE